MLGLALASGCTELNGGGTDQDAAAPKDGGPDGGGAGPDPDASGPGGRSDGGDAGDARVDGGDPPGDGGPNCAPGVFDDSRFDRACFQ